MIKYIFANSKKKYLDKFEILKLQIILILTIFFPYVCILDI